MAVLATAAGLPALPQAAAASPVPIDEFLRVSSRLSGIPLDKSYSQMAETIWRLLSLQNESALHALVSTVSNLPEAALDQGLKRHHLDTTAQAVLMAWYTGAVPIRPTLFDHPVVRQMCGDLHQLADPHQPNAPVSFVFAYDEALTWQACRFTKPSAACGGAFGYWQEPPV